MSAAISDNFPLQHSLDRAASVRRFLGNGHSPDGPDRMWETLVGVALDFPALLRAAWRVAFDGLGGEGDFIPTRLVEDTRNGLLHAFAEVEPAMCAVRDAVAAWQQRTGRMAPEFDRMDGAMEEVRRLREDIFRDWDSFVEPMERPPGEPIPVDEAFARLAGMDKEAWLRHVEDYKRKRKTTAAPGPDAPVAFSD